MLLSRLRLDKQGLNRTGHFNLGFLIGFTPIMLLGFILDRSTMGALFIGWLAGFTIGIIEAAMYPGSDSEAER